MKLVRSLTTFLELYFIEEIGEILYLPITSYTFQGTKTVCAHNIYLKILSSEYYTNMGKNMPAMLYGRVYYLYLYSTSIYRNNLIYRKSDIKLN